MSDGGEGEGRAKKRSFVSRLSRKLPNPLRRSRPDSDEEGVPPIPETPSQEIPEDAASTPLHVGERPTTSEREGAFKTKFSDTEGSGGVSGAGVTRMVNMSSDHATDDTPAPLLRSERGIRSARTAASSTGGVSGVDAIPKKRDAPAVYGVAEIVLTGVKGVPKEVLKMLRERGFVVHLAMTYEEVEPAALTVVLALGPKLMKKCAIERKLPVKAREQYSPGEVSELCAHAIKVIYRSGLKFDQVDLLHDKDALAEVMKAERADVVDAVNSYFGPYFGLYFAWLSFYTRALIIPAVGGLLLWLWQWGSGTPDGPYLPISCVVLMFWATVFLELWRRRNREIAYRWGVDGVEDDENMRVVAEKGGEYKPAPIGKFFVTVPIICGAIYAIIRIMLYCTWLSDNALEVYGEESYMKYLAHVLHAVVPLVAGSLYGSLAKVLNNYEEHPTQVQRKNMLVMKMFAFQFVNSYCALFYVAFWLRDLDRLRALLTTMMLVKQFVAQLREKYQPRIYTWWRHRNEEKEPKEPRYVVKHEGTVTPEEVLRELTAGPGTVEDDYLEMVLQFGYVAMFAAVYPLAPLTAIVNNLWEFRLDLNILGTTRRPKAQAESRIGAWELCLEVICVVACLTNILLALVVSDNASAYVPASLSEQLGSTEGKVILAVVVEHSMLLLKAVINGLVDDQPRVVREAKMAAAVKDLEKEKNAKRVASGLAVSKGGVSSPGVELSPKNRLQHLHKTYGVWGINPMWYLPLAALPFVVARLEMSAWWILPVAVVILGYLQHRKDKASAALALGIVKDPKVLKLVTDFLPAWYKESDFERMEWCNRILDKLWVPASAATREVLFANVQPLLESYRPSGISALGLRKVTLGTIPPKVVGVRTLGMTGNKAAIDLDLRWAGNAEFVLEAGVKPVPLVITLDKIRFSGRMRVELAPLVPVFPCFGAIVFTFLEKPFLDFSFSLGKLDVMSIGPGEASVGAAVSNMIRNILNGMMVFPKKMVIPILPEQDVMGLSNPVPKGVVQVVVVGADNLPKADLTGKSDPYVKIAVGQAEKAKTDVKSNTLSPRWNEIFDMLVYEPSVEVIRFNVMDQDTTGEDDSLGHCELPISMLKEGEESAHNIALSGAKSGSLLIKTTFVPLSSGPAPEVGVDADGDVILSLAGDAITDDTVASDDQGAPAGTVGAKPPKSQKSEDPSKLPPTVVNADDSMGVLTIMGIECKGVKKGDRYVSVIVGNTKRKTPVEKGKSSFAYSDVFHFLVKGAKSATVEVLLKEDETIRRNRVVGSFKLYVAEVMANEDELDGEWDLTGEDAQGSIKMRLNAGTRRNLNDLLLWVTQGAAWQNSSSFAVSKGGLAELVERGLPNLMPRCTAGQGHIQATSLLLLCVALLDLVPYAERISLP